MPAPSPLARRAFAEFLGTALLVTVVVGSGIAAQRLSPHDTGLQLFENSATTAAGLVALILALGPVSGAHFNPVVTAVDAVLHGMPRGDAVAYAGAQVSGGAFGAVLANLMFDERAVEWSTRARNGSHLWLSEVIATFGLLVVIFGVVRSGRATAAPFAVGAYIGAAYFFTSSTSFANPAVTVARTLSNTFAGIEPASAPAFVVSQVVGAALALGAIRFLYPDIDAVADDVVMPHDGGSTFTTGEHA